MKKELLLFITKKYFNINQDLIDNKYQLFDEVILLNEDNLDETIKDIINDIRNKYDEKGYGYWIWKPYLILQELNKLNDGDILVFLDAHCKLDKVKDKFNDIINYLQNKSLIIGLEGSDDYRNTTTKLRKAVEQYLNYEYSDKELSSFQYEGGILFMKKDNFTINFFKQYFEIMNQNRDVITDIYNDDINNHKDFIENRHDQSVCSLLAKYYKINNFDITWVTMH